jgi:bifunctional DNA-binding transcriptional regulator/antitoxin component of YhaV-PrlF toxin-antitoxin module
MSVVGSKGQIVIDKVLRDRLGVAAGWRTRQSTEANRLVVEFLPPVHSDSLAGCLAPHMRPGVAPASEEDIDRHVEDALTEDWDDRD